MESYAITYGMRIKYIKDGHLLVSTKIYSNGHQMVRVVIDTEQMIYKLIDPVTGTVYKQSDKKISNLEVLQRHVKKGLTSYLKISFEKEVRDVNND